jgi:hypothetical protein
MSRQIDCPAGQVHTKLPIRSRSNCRPASKTQGAGFSDTYQMDYGAANAKYIDAFFTNINWDAVARRA